MKNGPEARKAANMIRTGQDSDSDDDDSHYSYDDDPAGALRSDVKMSLEIQMDKLLDSDGDDDADGGDKEKNQARIYLIKTWKSHADVWVVDDAIIGDHAEGADLLHADYRCTAFSPYAIPRVVLLCQRYGCGESYSYSELSLSWTYRLRAFSADKKADSRSSVTTKLVSMEYVNSEGKTFLAIPDFSC